MMTIIYNPNIFIVLATGNLIVTKICLWDEVDTDKGILWYGPEID
jgi:hypothetical protein